MEQNLLWLPFRKKDQIQSKLPDGHGVQAAEFVGQEPAKQFVPSNSISMPRPTKRQSARAEDGPMPTTWEQALYDCTQFRGLSFAEEPDPVAPNSLFNPKWQQERPIFTKSVMEKAKAEEIERQKMLKYSSFASEHNQAKKRDAQAYYEKRDKAHRDEIRDALLKSLQRVEALGEAIRNLEPVRDPAVQRTQAAAILNAGSSGGSEIFETYKEREEKRARAFWLAAHDPNKRPVTKPEEPALKSILRRARHTAPESLRVAFNEGEENDVLAVVGKTDIQKRKSVAASNKINVRDFEYEDPERLYIWFPNGVRCQPGARKLRKKAAFADLAAVYRFKRGTAPKPKSQQGKDQPIMEGILGEEPRSVGKVAWQLQCKLDRSRRTPWNKACGRNMPGSVDWDSEEMENWDIGPLRKVYTYRSEAAQELIDLGMVDENGIYKGPCFNGHACQNDVEKVVEAAQAPVA